jgi:ankyrin repeat protein
MYYFQKYHSVNNLNDIDKFLQNPLHIACSLGSYELITYLVDSGQIDLYAQDANGNTCMHLAAKSGLPRSCWHIAQQNRGECIRLISIPNKKNQLPIDVIADESEPP